VAPSEFNGFAGARGKRIVVVEDAHRQVLVVDGRPYMHWTIGDVLTKRLAIVQLHELHLGSQEEIAAAFGISTKSVYNYIRMFAVEGPAGFTATRGPKSRWKITAQVRGKILHAFLKEGIVEYQPIKQRLAAWGEKVGTSSIRQVLLENGLVPEGAVASDLANPVELFDTEGDEQQLVFQFPRAEAWDRGASVAQQGQPPSALAAGRQHNGGPGIGHIESTARRQYSPGQRMYLDQLKQGSYNSYAGGLLFSPFLCQYPFASTIREVLQFASHEGYTLEELSETLFYLDVFGFRSLEDFKRVYAEEFGVLIGRGASPSHFTLRRFLHKVRKLARTEQLIEAFSRMYLKTELAKWGVLYIDAHFLPYYGRVPITKGWHGVRKIPMKGSYHFLGVDERFIPWIFLLRSSSEDLLQKIPELIDKAKEAARDAGVEPKRIEELIVVFDREGFSGPLYGYLDGRDREQGHKRAVFVSWAKYADKWVYEIPDSAFDKTAVVCYQIQKPEEIRYTETERRMSKYGTIRAIVIQRAADGKRMAIYTNADTGQIDGQQVVQLMCRRWGQENLIKELLGKHFINYMPGYVREPMHAQPLVDNPRVKQLKKRRGALTGELHDLKVQLADAILKGANDQTRWEQIRGQEVPLLTEIVTRENQMLFLDRELEGLPAELPYDQAHGGRRLERLNYEKKRFLDCIKLYAYNARKSMGELLLQHYDKEKEILPALSMIVNRGGTVRLQSGRLRVRLKRFRNPEIDYAARGLCEDINRMDPVTADRFHLPLRFEVA
jgi:transposase